MKVTAKVLAHEREEPSGEGGERAGAPLLASTPPHAHVLHPLVDVETAGPRISWNDMGIDAILLGGLPATALRPMFGIV